MKTFYAFILFFVPLMLHAGLEDADFKRNAETFFDLTTVEVEECLQDFLENVYSPILKKNTKVMKACDMFSLYLSLKLVNPEVVIESGSWQGHATDVVRKTLGDDCIIICLGPVNPEGLGIKKDPSENTIYRTGRDTIDFSKIDLSAYLSVFSNDKVFAVFYDYVNELERVFECLLLDIKYAYFHWNYPKGSGPYTTIEHMIHTEDEDLCIESDLPFNKEKFLSHLKTYNMFPNIFPGDIDAMGKTHKCFHLLEETEDNIDNYHIFYRDRGSYRWGTFVEFQ